MGGGGQLERKEARGSVQTVLGLIAPEALGATLMHEHIFVDLVSPRAAASIEPESEIALENVFAINYGRVKHNGKFRLDSAEVGISEVNAMKAAGGRAIVELTCGGIKPNPSGLVAVSKATGVHIIMGAGWYRETFFPAELQRRSTRDLANEIPNLFVIGLLVGRGGVAHIAPYVVAREKPEAISSPS